MKISFIVLTYNRSDALLAVLRSLARQCGAGHEVLVADDGSNPIQVDLLRQKCPAFDCPIRHVWHPDTGFTAARARNLGAYHAAGDYLVFLDGRMGLILAISNAEGTYYRYLKLWLAAQQKNSMK